MQVLPRTQNPDPRTGTQTQNPEPEPRTQTPEPEPRTQNPDPRTTRLLNQHILKEQQNNL